ncbi:MAG: SGNH/GDSL hydrolase family protein [Oscillochloris sp.]|nr:SGNH/GDSL hydrolase family protein [Oscillochloris sp.]
MAQGRFGLRLASNASLALGPLLLYQGRMVRRNTPQLPGAAGPSAGLVDASGPPLHFLILGESTVAGVGAATHADGLAGRTAEALAVQLGRAVRWRAEGRIGMTASSTRRILVPNLPPEPVDVALLALGVNDSLKLRSPERWVADLRALVAALRERVGPARVFLAAVPPLARFPALPQPLRAVLGLRARLLDAAAADLAPKLAAVVHLPITIPVTPDQFCADRFHPGPAGYARWGELLGAGMAQRLQHDA